ncbi:reverse transcriptase domain-containing protein [Tanacetum coccineum]
MENSSVERSQCKGKAELEVIGNDMLRVSLATLMLDIDGVADKHNVADWICVVLTGGAVMEKVQKQLFLQPIYSTAEYIAVLLMHRKSCWILKFISWASALFQLEEPITKRCPEISNSKNWLEEISHVLWAHRTMVKSSNGETPFSLTYGMEAVIPAEIGIPTFRTAEVNVAENDEVLEINLELLEEKREQATIREANSKRQMEKYYNTKVRNTSFKPGDLVYRSNEASHVEDTGKLRPKWEGPYEVTEALGKGSYKLKDRNGKELPRTWNICNLKKCYVHKM